MRMYVSRHLRVLCGVFAVLMIQSTSHGEQQFATEDPKAESIIPDPAVRKVIEKNEERLLKYVLAAYEPGLKKLLADSMSYVNENGQVSTRDEFFRDYLSKGYIDARLEPKEEMRQFGSTVTTVSRGYFRLKGEREYPTTAVTHI